MAFRLLQRDSDGAITPALPDQYTLKTEALAAAQEFCTRWNVRVIVTEDVAEVAMAPVVTALVEPPGPTPRAPAGLQSPAAMELLEEQAPRQPQAKPRLLVLKDRRATPAELVGHLMVVADGAIVKNAFGGLELDDMPLTGPELAEVMSALGKSQ